MRLYLAEGLGFEPSHNSFRDCRATATLDLNIKQFNVLRLSRNKTHSTVELGECDSQLW